MYANLGQDQTNITSCYLKILSSLLIVVVIPHRPSARDWRDVPTILARFFGMDAEPSSGG